METLKLQWESAMCEICVLGTNDVVTDSQVGNVTTTKKVDIGVTDEGDF